MKRNAVITGRGLVTPLGFGLQANLNALKSGKSGISHRKQWEEYGMDSQVAGAVDYDFDCPVFDRKKLRFMPKNAKMAVAAAYEAIVEAGYSPETLPGERMAIVNGCAGSCYAEVYNGAAVYEATRNLRKVSAFCVPRIMPSSAVANMSLIFGIRGESYDISCACTSGTIAIITGARLILSGEYDIVLVGGSEEISWQQALGFTAMRALSHSYNNAPEMASRPFDANRDGFVIAEAAGMLILESEEHALARGAKSRGRISGFASNSNATDMVAPDVEASTNVMAAALRNAGLAPADIQYINTHGTSTKLGDPVEMDAIKRLFHENGARPAINSTKSQTGHTIGAAGAIEAIFTSLMLEHSFVSASCNLENPDEEFAWADLVRATREGVELRHAISNSFGFGGSNASIVISKS